MILTGENWSAGRKTYSVGGRWMNDYGAMVEWYWQGKTEVVGRKTSYSLGGRWMNEYGTMVEWYWQGKSEVVGRKTSYSVGGRWMNEYGTMVEWYWQGKSEVVGSETSYSVGGRWMNEYGTMVEWYWQGKSEVVGRKTSYSVGGRWMNEYRAMVEWYWQGKTEVHVQKPVHKSACRLIWPRGLLGWYVAVLEIIRSCKFGWLSTGSRTELQPKISQNLCISCDKWLPGAAVVVLVRETLGNSLSDILTTTDPSYMSDDVRCYTY